MQTALAIEAEAVGLCIEIGAWVAKSKPEGERPSGRLVIKLRKRRNELEARLVTRGWGPEVLYRIFALVFLEFCKKSKWVAANAVLEVKPLFFLSALHFYEARTLCKACGGKPLLLAEALSSGLPLLCPRTNDLLFYATAECNSPLAWCALASHPACAALRRQVCWLDAAMLDAADRAGPSFLASVMLTAGEQRLGLSNGFLSELAGKLIEDGDVQIYTNFAHGLAMPCPPALATAFESTPEALSAKNILAASLSSALAVSIDSETGLIRASEDVKSFLAACQIAINLRSLAASNDDDAGINLILVAVQKAYS